MHALIMTGPSAGAGLTTVGQLPDPVPGPGEVSVDVAWAGLNFVDVMARRGDPGYATWPYTPGLEVAGTIRETGPGVTGLSPGQPVAALTPAGGLAGIAIAPAALTVAVPDGVPLRTAAAAPAQLTTALLLLTAAARISEGENVLVYSASGGVGGAVARLVPLLHGGQRIGVVGDPKKIPAALEAGYDTAVARSADTAGFVAEVRAAAKAAPDVILDPLGTAMLAADLELLAPGGRIVLFGNAGGGQPAPLPDLRQLMRGNVTVSGFSISALSVTAPSRVASALRHVLELLASGELEQPVTEVGSLADVPAVHDLMASGAGLGKYVAAVATGR